LQVTICFAASCRYMQYMLACYKAHVYRQAVTCSVYPSLISNHPEPNW